jgi:hypothetical protein
MKLTCGPIAAFSAALRLCVNSSAQACFAASAADHRPAQTCGRLLRQCDCDAALVGERRRVWEAEMDGKCFVKMMLCDSNPMRCNCGESCGARPESH